MQKQKPKAWNELTNLQRETLREFDNWQRKEFEVNDWASCFLEAEGDLCTHAITSEHPRSIYGWKTCKPCLMQLFKIRKDLIKKEKAHVPTRKVGRNLMESANAQTDSPRGEESGPERNQPKMEVG